MSLGLEPQQPVHLDLVSAPMMRRVQDANQQLVQVAKPILDTLARAIANTKYFAILTNADGVVIDVNGPIDRSDPCVDAIARIGVDLSERSVGTTAIGAALREQEPVWLHRGEHFFPDTSHYSCAGAPVLGPDGTCVGMLDLTGVDVVERPELKHMAAQFASKIGNALILKQSHSVLLRLNWPGNALGSDADGMICLDADGYVTGANQIARQLLPELAVQDASALHVSDIFGVSHQMLFDDLQRPDLTMELPLWSGLTVQVRPTERSLEPLAPPASRRQRAFDQLPLKDIEIGLIRKAVERARGNVAAAARTLGISRATVYRKLGKPK
jgi:transcriptional regulator of acetoin/glycerol metabolism